MGQSEDRHSEQPGRAEWPAWVAKLLFGGHDGERPPGAHFVQDVLRHFERGMVLQDPAIGQWFANVEAVDYGDDLTSDRIGIRFLLTREPHLAPKELRSEPLFAPQKVFC